MFLFCIFIFALMYPVSGPFVLRSTTRTFFSSCIQLRTARLQRQQYSSTRIICTLVSSRRTEYYCICMCFVRIINTGYILQYSSRWGLFLFVDTLTQQLGVCPFVFSDRSSLYYPPTSNLTALSPLTLPTASKGPAIPQRSYSPLRSVINIPYQYITR